MTDQRAVGRFYEEDASDVAVIPARPSWHTMAACRGDLGWFDRDPDECKAVCAVCAVRGPCKAARIANDERHGVWAGEDVDEQRAYLAARAAREREKWAARDPEEHAAHLARRRERAQARRADRDQTATVADTARGSSAWPEQPSHAREVAGSNPAPATNDQGEPTT